MDYLRSYQLPPLWNQPQTHDGFPPLRPLERGALALALTNEHAFLDISLGSHHDDSFGFMTKEGSVAKLKHVRQQLLQTRTMVFKKWWQRYRYSEAHNTKVIWFELWMMAAPNDVINAWVHTKVHLWCSICTVMVWPGHYFCWCITMSCFCEQWCIVEKWRYIESSGTKRSRPTGISPIVGQSHFRFFSSGSFRWCCSWFLET